MVWPTLYSRVHYPAPRLCRPLASRVTFPVCIPCISFLPLSLSIPVVAPLPFPSLVLTCSCGYRTLSAPRACESLRLPFLLPVHPLPRRRGLNRPRRPCTRACIGFGPVLGSAVTARGRRPSFSFAPLVTRFLAATLQPCARSLAREETVPSHPRRRHMLQKLDAFSVYRTCKSGLVCMYIRSARQCVCIV
ncbi:hypothetical protein C8Q80DRAFT_201633 [Daedaleopsis nitida]|nr:hypothetical protein C8Q80DRAFT_201633 [Daedaleopsis nitida]